MAAGIFMEGLDSTILNTAIPQAAASLRTTPAALSLAVTSYLLALAVFIPVSGWMADRFGAKRIFCGAMVVFTIGSTFCGLSSTLEALVAARIVQGVGGAMMMPVGRLIIARSFPREQLIVAMSYMAIPGMIGPMLGPVVGGFLTAYVSWHWIFFINIPIGIVGLTLALSVIPDIPKMPLTTFDFAGFAIVGLGLASLQLSIEFLGRNFVPVPVEAALVLTTAGMFYLYVRHARRRPDPLIDLRLFHIRPFTISILSGGLSRIGILSSPFLLPLLFQIGFGMDAFESGLLVGISTVGAIFTRFGSPTLLRRFGIRRTLVVNSVVLASMLAGFILFSPHTPIVLLVPYIFLFGIARTVQFSALNVLGLDVPPDLLSKGTSVAAVSQRMAQSAGVAVAATLMTLVTAPGEPIGLNGFAIIFAAMALIEITSLIGFRRLSPDDGQSMTGHRGLGGKGGL